jgi:Fe-S cluster assembly protein SufB
MVKNQSNESEAVVLDDIVTTPYKYGFTTDLETEEFEKGLNDNIISKISSKKDEPEFLRKFRDKAFNSWKKMDSPLWAALTIPEIDYDNIQPRGPPKTKKKLS